MNHEGMTRSTTVTDLPKDHIIWSLFSFVYCNPCCLGLLALVNSVKTRDRVIVGDLEGARSHAVSARKFNIAAAVMACVMSVILIIVVAISDE